MPLIKLQVSQSVPADKRPELLASMSKILVDGIGKPEQYVMASLDTASMLMGGAADPAAFAEVKSIGGLGPEVNRKIASDLCALLQNTLQIPPDRVYINYVDIPRGDWGWNSRTFG